MRSLNYIRWIYAIIATAVGALFLYVAIDEFAGDDQTMERIVAAVIGGAFALLGCGLAPIWRR